MFRHFIRTMNHWTGNTIMSRKKAVLYHWPNEDRFVFSFHLECLQPKINNQFNMARSSSETLESFINRLKENVGKKLEKKNKKKVKKSKSDDCGASTEVERVIAIEW